MRKTITFIYAFDTKDDWNIPIALMNEFKSRGYRTEVVNLFNGHKEYSSENIEQYIKTCKEDPGIIFFSDIGRFVNQEHTFEKLKKRFPQTYFIQESADDPQNFSVNHKISKYFDLVLTSDYNSFKTYHQLLRPAVWWPHFSDTRMYHPDKVLLNKDDAWHIYKSKFDQVRTSRGPDHAFNRVEQMFGTTVFQNKRFNRPVDHAQFLQEGRITYQHSRFGEVTRRVFEAMSCMNLVITDRPNETTNYRDIFTEKEHIVLFSPNTVIQPVSLINYYLKRTDEAFERAYNGCLLVHEHHTQKNRIDTIEKVLYG